MTPQIPPANERRYSILIAEDSLTQAVQLQFLLENEGFTVTAARNGVEGLDCIERDRPDLVMSDVVMPEMNGYEFCRQIKSNPNLQDIPVILLTTLSDPDDIFKGLDCGADYYVLKPYTEHTLLSRIRSVLADKNMSAIAQSQMGLEINYAGKKHFITANRIQILDLLLVTFENVVKKNRELENLNRQLKESLETIKTLKGLIPICAYCRKIRDDEGFWRQLEAFVMSHSDAKFSHGICPDCITKFSPIATARMILACRQLPRLPSEESKWAAGMPRYHARGSRAATTPLEPMMYM